jgi:ElaB/YqjD/DUF883 family membrane-anchored ribosome-binding protein
MATATSEKLADDLRRVASDAEMLWRETRHAAGDRVREAGDRAKAAADDANHYVHRHPWSSAALAAGAGVLIGLLLGRR